MLKEKYVEDDYKGVFRDIIKNSEFVEPNVENMRSIGAFGIVFVLPLSIVGSNK